MILDTKDITLSGTFPRVATICDEWDKDIDQPECIICELKRSPIRVDLFSFSQRLPQSRPIYNYHVEWDNVAAIPVTSYNHWLHHVIHPTSRNKILLAIKRGVTLQFFNLDDTILRRIMEIYHETPLRQGVPFTDYRIDFATAKKGNATYLDRAIFIGAFFNSELIGFVKLVPSGSFMRTMGILAKVSHRDKAPVNLLISKSVELCAAKKIPYLVYGKFIYPKGGSLTLRDFKRHLGFESIVLPRYYVPLNRWGKLALALNLHRGITALFPRPLIGPLKYLRRTYYVWLHSLHRSSFMPKNACHSKPSL